MARNDSLTLFDALFSLYVAADICVEPEEQLQNGWQPKIKELRERNLACCTQSNMWTGVVDCQYFSGLGRFLRKMIDDKLCRWAHQQRPDVKIWIRWKGWESIWMEFGWLVNFHTNFDFSYTVRHCWWQDVCRWKQLQRKTSGVELDTCLRGCFISKCLWRAWLVKCFVVQHRLETDSQ